jgi:replicative DNA helicase
MAVTDSNVLKLAPDAGTPAYRNAPHNIEAEQSLLGAILVNNDAFYRVSDFLESKHFFEPLHQTIFDTASSLIRMGKVATPVTLKTFLPADADIGGMTIGQYLARLAAEATTIINAQDYGRTIYDMSLRRDLIRIGEDMVNVAFEAPVDFAPRAQIEDAERQLYELAESGRYEGGFQRFSQAMKTAIDMAANAYQRDGKLSGISTGLRDLDSKMGGLQRSDLIVLAGRPGMGKTSLATNIAYNIARAYQPETKADGTTAAANGGVVGFYSCEMSAEQLATRILAEQTRISSSMIRRGGIKQEEFDRLRDYTIELEHLPLYVDETGGLSISQLTARARRLKRQKGLDVIMVDYIQLLSGSGSAATTTVSRKSPKSPPTSRHWQKNSMCLSSRCLSFRARSKTVTTSIRNCPTCVNPARSSRTPTWCCSSTAKNITCRTKSPRWARPSGRNGSSTWSSRTARPRSSSPSSATDRRARSRCSSRDNTRASAISSKRTICPTACRDPGFKCG